MLSRRRFLSLGSLTAGLSLSPRSLWAQPQPATPPQLPPSIAALSSMRDLARPIATAERQGRIEKARRLMAAEKLDALVLTGGTSLVYFTGIRWGLSERLFAAVVPAKGAPFVVCPAFERDRAMEQVGQGPLAGADLRVWEEHESPYALVAQGLRERGVATGRLGVEETVRFVFSDGIAQAAPALALVSGTPVTAGCRMVKDPHEIELMRLASKVTLKAYAAAFQAARPGMTQQQFAALVSTAHSRLGFTGGGGVQVGEYSALPHGSITPQTITENSVVLIDGGCSVEGYSSDISRTFILGTPTDKMRKVFEIVHRAQQSALAAARPGVPCGRVDDAARKTITEAGYGPDYKYFSHRLGHGLGMDGHEWPYIVGGNMLPLQPGMVFSDEPGIYIRGEFGVRLEDDMLITENGAELFTPQSPSIDAPYEGI